MTDAEKAAYQLGEMNAVRAIDREMLRTLGVIKGIIDKAIIRPGKARKLRVEVSAEFLNLMVRSTEAMKHKNDELGIETPTFKVGDP